MSRPGLGAESREHAALLPPRAESWIIGGFVRSAVKECRENARGKLKFSASLKPCGGPVATFRHPL